MSSIVDEALKRVESVLNTTRYPIAPEDTDHTYDDKYALVEAMTNTFIASCVTVFQKFGLTTDSLERVLNAVHEKQQPVTLSFHMDRTCTFDKQTERKVVVAEHEVETSNDGSGLIGRLTKQIENVKVKETIQEYHYILKTPYRFYLKLGDEDEIELSRRDDMERSVTIVGGRERPPTPYSPRIYKYEVNLTWLFQRITLKGGDKFQPLSDFSIDRLDETCKTPRRNQQIEKAGIFKRELLYWEANIYNCWVNMGHSSFSISFSQLKHLSNEVFSPIIPLFENSSVLTQSDYDLFLTKHSHSLDELVEKIESDKSHNEWTKLFLLFNLPNLGKEWANSVVYVESMLERQLVNAIGKVLSKQDFEEFIRFYSKKIFEAQYAPKPFSYAVRRGDHFPDGMVSIEESKSNRDPVMTLVRRVAGETSPPISIPLSAATSIDIQGDRLVHGE